MDLCFDTSGINRLYDDPERDAIVPALLRVLVTGLNVAEVAATEETQRRIGLLRLQRKLIGSLRPLHVPTELLQVVTIAYAERRPTATITIGDRQQGLWWALEEPESLDEEARQETHAWKRALEDPFREAHRLARPEFQRLSFDAAQDRPLSASKLIKLFRGQERIVYDAVAPLWKRLIGTDLLIENLSRLAGAGTAMASVPCGLGSRNTEASYQGAELRRRESPRSDRSALRDLPVPLRLLRNGRCGTAASTPGSQCPKPPQSADSVIQRTPNKACAGRC